MSNIINLIIGGVFLLIAIIIALGLYGLYVSIVQKKNAVMEALSGIDVQLKKRCDLIPNLLTIAKKFMEHETELFGEITALRAKAQSAKSGSSEKFQAEAALDSRMSALMLNVENYPQLKSDTLMIQAMNSYNEVEENISAARRFYNSSLTQLRNAIQIFPGTLFAGCAGEAASYSYFETDAKSREPVNAANYL